MIDNQLFFTHNECTMINSSKTHFGILQYAAIIPIPGKELQTSAEIVTFSLFDLTGVRFPKERIRKGLTGSLRVSLTHSLRQSEKYGAGGEVTFSILLPTDQSGPSTVSQRFSFNLSAERFCRRI